MTAVASPPSVAKAGTTRRLAEYVAGLHYEQLPAATIDQAKKAILDFLGIAIRASAEEGSSVVVRQVVDELDAGGSTTAIGIGAHYHAQYAALLNGTFAHTLDFDDTHAASSLHPGATVIAAVLAIAEARRAGGAQVIAAIVAGYDAVIRIGEALGAAAHYNRGFHPTATCGTFGATAAIGNVAGASADVIENAFGLNGSQAAGSMQFLANGSWNKRMHVGFTAHNAILALRFASAGAVGASEALEGVNGFLHAYTDGPDVEQVTRWLGERYAIDETGFKPYPSCRYSHAGVDMLLEIMAEEKLSASDIERVRIGLTHAGNEIIGVPEAYKRAPRSVVDGQFSMHFSAAAAAITGRLGWDEYTLLEDPRIVAMMERIDVFEDPEAQRFAPRMAATIAVRAKGRTIRRVSDTPKGEPEKPLAWEDVIAKFDLLATPYSSERRARIVSLVRDLGDITDITELTAQLGAAGE